MWKAVVGKDESVEGPRLDRILWPRGMGLPRSHRETPRELQVCIEVHACTRVRTSIFHEGRGEGEGGGGLIFTVKATDLRGPSLSIVGSQVRLNPRLTPEDNNSWLEWRSQKGNSDESVMILHATRRGIKPLPIVPRGFFFSFSSSFFFFSFCFAFT